MSKKLPTQVPTGEKTDAREVVGIPAAQDALIALIPEIEQLAQKFHGIFHILIEPGGEELKTESDFANQLRFATLLGTSGIHYRLLEEIIPSLRETAALKESDFHPEAEPEKPVGKQEKRPKEGPRTKAHLQADLVATRLALARHRKEWHSALRGITKMLEDLPKVGHLMRILGEDGPNDPDTGELGGNLGSKKLIN